MNTYTVSLSDHRDAHTRHTQDTPEGYKYSIYYCKVWHTYTLATMRRTKRTAGMGVSNAKTQMIRRTNCTCTLMGRTTNGAGMTQHLVLTVLLINSCWTFGVDRGTGFQCSFIVRLLSTHSWIGQQHMCIDGMHAQDIVT